MSTVETRYYALDLIDDIDLIAEYEEYHKKVWPDIIKTIRDKGYLSMEIYRVENRLFMVAEVDTSVSPPSTLPIEEEWEDLMWTYQQALPRSKPGEKWRPMKKIFDLSDYEEE